MAPTGGRHVALLTLSLTLLAACIARLFALHAPEPYMVSVAGGLWAGGRVGGPQLRLPPGPEAGMGNIPTPHCLHCTLPFPLVLVPLPRASLH